MDLYEAMQIESECRKKQKATKYSDAEIKRVVEGAINSPIEFATGNALTALAMIAYNNMIDRRWNK